MNCHESIHKLWDHLMQADLNSGLFAGGGANLPLKKPEVRPQGILWPVYQLAQSPSMDYKATHYARQ